MFERDLFKGSGSTDCIVVINSTIECDFILGNRVNAQNAKHVKVDMSPETTLACGC